VIVIDVSLYHDDHTIAYFWLPIIELYLEYVPFNILTSVFFQNVIALKSIDLHESIDREKIAHKMEAISVLESLPLLKY